MPDLATLIDDSHLALVLVGLEQLDYFALDVKVVELVSFVLLRCSIRSSLVQWNYVLAGQDLLSGETVLDPLA